MDVPVVSRPEIIYINSVRRQDVFCKKCRERSMIGTDGERQTTKSVPAARLDDKVEGP